MTIRASMCGDRRAHRARGGGDGAGGGAECRDVNTDEHRVCFSPSAEARKQAALKE